MKDIPWNFSIRKYILPFYRHQNSITFVFWQLLRDSEIHFHKKKKKKDQGCIDVDRMKDVSVGENGWEYGEVKSPET